MECEKRRAGNVRLVALRRVGVGGGTRRALACEAETDPEPLPEAFLGIVVVVVVEDREVRQLESEGLHRGGKLLGRGGGGGVGVGRHCEVKRGLCVCVCTGAGAGGDGDGKKQKFWQVERLLLLKSTWEQSREREGTRGGSCCEAGTQRPGEILAYPPLPQAEYLS